MGWDVCWCPNGVQPQTIFSCGGGKQSCSIFMIFCLVSRAPPTLCQFGFTADAYRQTA